MVRVLKNIASIEKRLRTANRRRNPPKRGWVDLFPWVHGTLPEKMVYAELSRRGIPFLFLNDVGINIPEISLNKDYQADFVIPQLRLIIEVQGAYWHSKPDTIEADAYKFTLYEAMGYRVLAWWDFDILSDLISLFESEPSLRALTVTSQVRASTELPVQKRTKVDTSIGIRTLNARRYRGTVQRAARRSLRRAVR